MTTSRVAIVTGASRGIGAHLAEALEQAGWVVERGSRSVAEVTDPTAVAAWVRDIVARRGRIDLLVNNAGVIDDEVALWEADPERWWRTVEINVRGPFLMTRAVVPHMRAAGGGRVVNINSGAAYRGYDISTAYNTGKAALHQLTVATDHARDSGVRAFDLAPGVVRTDMTLGMGAHDGRTDWTDPADVVELLLAIADGHLDAWAGRMVRAGTDTPASLAARAAAGLDDDARRLGLISWGADDPLI
ncbi:SDR family oxidoreductase [Janibacter sp. G56]|uniref:SDR family oxidoreductase n=1 Tax=Janibacter sp. G56 TaxID=3418717 RepID=UPI003D038792